MSGFEGDGDKGQGRAHARPLLFLCSSAGSFFFFFFFFFLPWAERGEGTLAGGMLLPVLNNNYRNGLSEGQEGCFLLLSVLANDGGVLLLSMLVNCLIDGMVGWLEAECKNKKYAGE